MNCELTQETILDSLTGPLPEERRISMESHLSTCENCRQFAAIQRSLDAQLAGALRPFDLSAGFRASLRERLRDDTSSRWRESLPDIAHLAGAAGGTLLLLLAFPRYSTTVALAGAAFTGATYFLQAVIRDSLEEQGDIS